MNKNIFKVKSNKELKKLNQLMKIIIIKMRKNCEIERFYRRYFFDLLEWMKTKDFLPEKREKKTHFKRGFLIFLKIFLIFYDWNFWCQGILYWHF